MRVSVSNKALFFEADFLRDDRSAAAAAAAACSQAPTHAVARFYKNTRLY
jgi:hypothetical protein